MVGARPRELAIPIWTGGRGFESRRSRFAVRPRGLLFRLMFVGRTQALVILVIGGFAVEAVEDPG
jgi:hypothetical protein